LIARNWVGLHTTLLDPASPSTLGAEEKGHPQHHDHNQNSTGQHQTTPSMTRLFFFHFQFMVTHELP
jgi:hypothetical protein